MKINMLFKAHIYLLCCILNQDHNCKHAPERTWSKHLTFQKLYTFCRKSSKLKIFSMIKNIIWGRWKIWSPGRCLLLARLERIINLYPRVTGQCPAGLGVLVSLSHQFSSCHHSARRRAGAGTQYPQVLDRGDTADRLNCHHTRATHAETWLQDTLHLKEYQYSIFILC